LRLARRWRSRKAREAEVQAELEGPEPAAEQLAEPEELVPERLAVVPEEEQEQEAVGAALPPRKIGAALA